MGERSLLASILADVCLWKCLIPSEQWECVGHRHFGAETEGRAGPPVLVLLCATLRKWGPLGIAETKQQGLGAELVVTTD